LAKLDENPGQPARKRDASGVCSVEGCARKRLYRCLRGKGGFESGGCGLEHFRLLESEGSKMDEM
jgi:hypothetical protein